MTEDLCNKFSAIDKALSADLTKYSIGKDGKDWEMVTTSQQEMSTLNELIEKIEKAVQERLHFEEA